MIDLTVITKNDITTEKINGFYNLQPLIELLNSFTYIDGKEKTIKVTVTEVKGEVNYGR